MLLLLLCLNCNILRDFFHRVASEAAVGLHLQGFQGEQKCSQSQHKSTLETNTNPRERGVFYQSYVPYTIQKFQKTKLPKDDARSKA